MRWQKMRGLQDAGFLYISLKRYLPHIFDIYLQFFQRIPFIIFVKHCFSNIVTSGDFMGNWNYGTMYTYQIPTITMANTSIIEFIQFVTQLKTYFHEKNSDFICKHLLWFLWMFSFFDYFKVSHTGLPNFDLQIFNFIIQNKNTKISFTLSLINVWPIVVK